MRRSDREITEINEIADILRDADTIRLAINNEPYPYVVPLSFGIEMVNQKIIIYFHGAKEGLKHELIAKNPHVCVESDIFYGYADSQNGLTVEYESVIGFGLCELLDGNRAEYAMGLLLSHCNCDDGYSYDRNALNAAAVYQITLSTVSGKRNRLS